MIENLGEDEGLEAFPQATKIALLDADTIIYAACSVNEYPEEMLDIGFYTPTEWDEIIEDTQWVASEHSIYRIHTKAAIAHCVDRIEEIIEVTNTVSAELYFTSGKNFRHIVDPMYKANRKHTRYPAGLKEIKLEMLKRYPGMIGDGMEADDIVVYLKRTQPEKYVLCAVDKDVLNALPGKHWNYYRSERYSIKSKWVDITKQHAEIWPYMQCLEGDAADNIKGCPGVGKKTALKLLANTTTAEERWNIVVKTFIQKKLTAKDALQTMRLVNMNQMDSNYKWLPWTQPTGGNNE